MQLNHKLGFDSINPPKHRNRHANAFRAGARHGIEDFAAELSKHLPPEFHSDLAALKRKLLKKDEYQYLMRHQREGTS